MGNDPVARQSRVIWVLDVSTPTAPAVLRRVPDLRWVRDLRVVGDRLWAIARLGDVPFVFGLGLSDPGSPSILAQAELGHGSLGRLATAGDRVYVSTARVSGGEVIGLQVFDASDSRTLTELGHLSAEHRLYVPIPLDSGHVALTHDRGLTVYEASDPGAIAERGSLGFHGWFKNVALTGRRVYLSNDHALQVLGPGEDGLEVLGTLYELGERSYLLNNPGLGLSADRGYAIVANQDTATLQIVDCRDPARPRLAGLFSSFPLSLPNRAILREEFAFVAPGLDPLLVLDLADPEDPTFVARVPGDDAFMRTGWTVDLFGDRIYALGSVTVGQDVRERVGVIDVTRPNDPRPLSVLGPWSEQARITDLAAIEDAAIVVWSDVHTQRQGLRVADFSDPDQPRWLEQELEIPALTSIRIHPNGRLAIARSWQEGLLVLDVGNRHALRVIARLPLMTDVAGIAFGEDDRVYAVSFWSGLHVFELDAGLIPTPRPTASSPAATPMPSTTPLPTREATAPAASSPTSTTPPVATVAPPATAPAVSPAPTTATEEPTPPPPPGVVTIYLPVTLRDAR